VWDWAIAFYEALAGAWADVAPRLWRLLTHHM